ncbi:hypothetical protein W02_20310 [Nitrospira sp. KM1]|nr:hypothetical protein W02_20310 [Nitrospira sp. KM1]
MDIHNHDVRAKDLGDLDGLESVTGLGDDLDIVVLRQHSPQTGAESRIVIYEGYSDYSLGGDQ